MVIHTSVPFAPTPKIFALTPKPQRSYGGSDFGVLRTQADASSQHARWCTHTPWPPVASNAIRYVLVRFHVARGVLQSGRTFITPQCDFSRMHPPKERPPARGRPPAAVRYAIGSNFHHAPVRFCADASSQRARRPPAAVRMRPSARPEN